MSAMAGVCERAGAPVRREALDAMAIALAHRGDGVPFVWRDGMVGLVQHLRPMTIEATRERGAQSTCAGVRIVFDGRLDNRAEVIAALGGSGISADATDPDLACHAYQRWGATCPERLAGDFAFAIWDPRARRLFCARDILGMRAFYYTATGARFAFASEAHALVRAGLASAAINDGMAGEYLATTVLSKTETLLRDVSRLAPAHTLIADARGIHIQRYWTPDPAYAIRYRRAEDYADHLRDLLRDAVRRKLRTQHGAAVMLSGGVDSSAILGAAVSLESGRRPEALSVTFPGLPCDEAAFSARMTEAAGVAARVYVAGYKSPEWLRAQAAAYLDVPDFPNGTMFEGAKEDAVARGVRVLLHGCGGDEWFTGSIYHYGDWLRQGRVLRMARQVARDARKYGPRRALFLATRVGIWPTAPLGLRLAVRRLLGRTDRTPPWIDRGFARRIDLAERLRWELPDRFRSYAQADMFRTGTSGINVLSDEFEDRSAARAGVEQRYPFYDRRLVEFGLAIPEEQRSGGGGDKRVLRAAIRPWVPDAIAGRVDKAEFSDGFVTTLRMLGGADAFRSLRTAELGWVDGQRIASMYDEMERSYASGSDRYRWLTDPLFAVLALEMWLDALSPRPEWTTSAAEVAAR